jgi:hypothetical protein
VRNLLSDPRAAFSVPTSDDPYPAVVMRCRASVRIADDDATVEEIHAITRRYVAPEGIEGYIANLPHLRTIVTIVQSTSRPGPSAIEPASCRPRPRRR